MSKDIRHLARSLRRDGYDIRLARSGHYHVRLKDRYIAMIPASLSDWRGLRNARADIQRRSKRTKEDQHGSHDNSHM